MKRVFANDRLRLSVTDACNFICTYCSNEGQTHDGKNFVDLGFVEKLSSFILKNQIFVKKLNLTGGEPLLHKDLTNIIKAFKGKTENISLNTNGQLLTEEKIIELHKAGVNCIKFGIDSFFQETTKPLCKHRNCNTSHIIECLFMAKKLMPRTSVNIVLTDFNFHEFEKMLNFIIDNRINYVEFLELINFDFRKNGKELLYGLRFKEVFRNHKKYFKKITYNKKIGKYVCETQNGVLVQFADDFCVSRVCRNLWTRVSSDGYLIPCIKGKDRIKIDFANLLNQISKNNNLMCDGPGKDIVRDYEGNLLNDGEVGEYFPTFPLILSENFIQYSKDDL